MNLKRSVDNLAKRLDKLDPAFSFSNSSGLSHWKGKPIIPMEEWIQIRNTPYALDYFPDVTRGTGMHCQLMMNKTSALQRWTQAGDKQVRSPTTCYQKISNWILRPDAEGQKAKGIQTLIIDIRDTS